MCKKLLNYTTYLVSKSSIVTGIGRIFDFAGSYEIYNSSESGDEADSKAMLLDWLVVGEDLKKGVKSFEKQL